MADRHRTRAQGKNAARIAFVKETCWGKVIPAYAAKSINPKNFGRIHFPSLAIEPGAVHRLIEIWSREWRTRTMHSVRTLRAVLAGATEADTQMLLSAIVKTVSVAIQDAMRYEEEIQSMNPNTGAIAKFENAADAKAAGHTVPIKAGDVDKVAMMNRRDRRAWAKQEIRDAKDRAKGRFRRRFKARK